MSQREGFQHPDGRLIYSIRYTLESPPPTVTQLVVPLDSDGNATGDDTFPAEPGKRIVQVKPGEEIVNYGKRYKVLKVEPYRWAGMK